MTLKCNHGPGYAGHSLKFYLYWKKKDAIWISLSDCSVRVHLGCEWRWVSQSNDLIFSIVFFFFKIFYDATNAEGKIMTSTNYKKKYAAVSKRKMGFVTTEQWFWSISCMFTWPDIPASPCPSCRAPLYSSRCHGQIANKKWLKGGRA